MLATLGQLEQQIEQSRSQIEVLNRDYKAKGEEVARTQAKLASTKKELDKAKKALSARQEALNQRLRAIYMAGSGGCLELLFTSNSFGDFLVRLDLLKRILKQDETLFNEIKAQQEVIEVQLAALRKQEQELLAQQNKLAALERDRRREQAKLVSSRQSYESYRRKLQANIREFEKALDELERESRRLESLIRSQQSPGTPQASGSFIWPVHGRISSEFGRRDSHPVIGQVRKPQRHRYCPACRQSSSGSTKRESDPQRLDQRLRLYCDHRPRRRHLYPLRPQFSPFGSGRTAGIQGANHSPGGQHWPEYRAPCPL